MSIIETKEVKIVLSYYITDHGKNSCECPCESTFLIDKDDEKTLRFLNEATSLFYCDSDISEQWVDPKTKTDTIESCITVLRPWIQAECDEDKQSSFSELIEEYKHNK